MPRMHSTSTAGITQPRIWLRLRRLEPSPEHRLGGRSRSTESSLSKEVSFMNPYRRRLGARVLTAVFAASLGMTQMTETPVSDEYLILGDANRGAGEPMIAVNRKDPNNILIVAMATLHRLPNGEIPDGVIPPSGPGVGGAVHSATQRVRELSTQDETVTDIAVSRDGGKTWSFSVDNFREVFHRNRCHDSFAGAGPDGTMYFGCIPHIASDNTDFDKGYSAGGEPENMRGGSAIAWSNDKGMTWSKPVMVHVDHAPELYAPNLSGKLRFAYASPGDRPY